MIDLKFLLTTTILSLTTLVGCSHSTTSFYDTHANRGQSVFDCPKGSEGLTPNLTATLNNHSDLIDDYNGSFLEGPVWVDNSLYVSQLQYAKTSRVLKFTPPMNLEIVPGISGTNGLAVNHHSQLVAGNHELGALVIYTTDGQTVDTLVDTFDGKRFNSPNDLAISNTGHIYFSDPSWQAPKPHPQSSNRLYHITPDGQLNAYESEWEMPNGITLSLDQHTLFVGGSGNSGVNQWKIDPKTGSLSNPKRFGAVKGADGMAIDCAGNLYVATTDEYIVVLSPQGEEIGRLKVTHGTTNVAFGGENNSTLFITAFGKANKGALYSIDIEIPGFPY